MAVAKLSLLDRLIDNDPATSKEAPLTEAEALRRIRAGVKRDIEDLLNTRHRCANWPPSLDQLDTSLLNYGIPDFTSAGMNAAVEYDLLLESIRGTIQSFEPRLRDIRLERVTNREYHDRTFRFRIFATLLIDPDEHRLQFESSLESETGQFDLK